MRPLPSTKIAVSEKKPIVSSTDQAAPLNSNQAQVVRLPAVLISGIVVGLLEVALVLSFCALIFSGPLASHLGAGIGLTLVGTIIASTIVALRTAIPGIVGGIQDAPVAIMTTITAAIVATLGETTSSDSLFATAVVAIAVTTLATGVCYYILGRFKLGNLIRFLPYPVIGGFMVGTGWLLAQGSIALMANSVARLPDLLQAGTLIQWLPGVLLAFLFLAVSERASNPLALPGLLVISTLLFWVIAWLSGATPDTLGAQGWLLGSFPSGALWQPITPALLVQADLGAVVSQVGNIAAIVLVSTAGLLLNASSMEVVTHQEGDLNQELRAAGVANMLAGLVGSLVAFQQLSISTLNQKLGANSRWTGIVGVAVCGLVLILGAGVLSLTPKMVVGGLLLYLGLSFLYDWLVKAWFQLPRIDYLIVLLILVVVAAIGFLEGVALGLLLAVILFVVSYSRTDVVRHELSGKTFRSRVTRPSAERDLLFSLGDQIHILELQGFVFFGTADRLLTRIRAHLAATAPDVPLYILLDFQRATGLDSTAMLSFQKLWQYSDATAVTILFTALPPAIRQQFVAAGLLEPSGPVRAMADLDQGVEWCEDQLLEAVGRPGATAVTLRDWLQPATADVEALLGYFDRLEIAAGDYLFRQGDAADNLYFIESGQLTARLEEAGKPPMRLETMGAGHVVGELGFYLQQARTAAVVAVEDSVVYRLTRARLNRMETADLQAAAVFHTRIIHLLAGRVTHLMGAVSALQK